MIITMAIHPGGRIGPAEVEHMARMLIGVHMLALVSIPVIFMGAWGMARRIGGADRLAWAGLVIFALASIAVMIAAVFDGLMAPAIMRKIVATPAEGREVWQTLMNFNFQMNQAFARVYSVGSSLAVLLWSAEILKGKALRMGIGIYGVLIGVATVGGIVSGFLTPDKHGFGLLILGQAIWFVAVAGEMWNFTPSKLADAQ